MTLPSCPSQQDNQEKTQRIEKSSTAKALTINRAEAIECLHAVKGIKDYTQYDPSVMSLVTR